MDFFTHFLIGVLVSSGASGFDSRLYLALGTFMSIAPDLDFLMYPLWKKIPFARHHGITHTLIFIFAASALIYAALLIMTGLSDIRLLLLMLLSGSLHIMGDFIGTGGVPMLYPLSRKYFKLNIDLGINPLLTLFSLAGMAMLFEAYLGRAYFPDAISASILLGSVLLLYYVSKTVLKLRQEKMPENTGFTALPTITPFRWKFARRTEMKDAIEISLKTESGVETYRIPKGRREIIARSEDLAYTYWHPQVQAEMCSFEFPCYRTICQGDKMEIIWNSAEMGKLMEINVICKDGMQRVKTRFRSKSL